MGKSPKHENPKASYIKEEDIMKIETIREKEKNEKKVLIPNTSRPVMRNNLRPIRLQRLHGIVQKEINQDGIDAREMRLVDTHLPRVFLCRALLRIFKGLGGGQRLAA